MQKLISAVLVCTGLMHCKPPASSSVKDAATTSSFKSGLFAPRALAAFSSPGSQPPRWTPEKFLAEYARATGQRGLSLRNEPGASYRVASSAAGEHFLSMMLATGSVAPTASIDSQGKAYVFSSVVLPGADGSQVLSSVLVRSPFGKPPVIDVAEMFVVRRIVNDDGYVEPVLVPWLRHVASETDRAKVSFRLGNVVYDSTTERPTYAFEAVDGVPNAFVITGSYKDADVKAGAVIWQGQKGRWYSWSGSGKEAVEWRVQDGDSLDRIGVLSLDKANLPPDLQAFVHSLPGENSPDHPARKPLPGFDWVHGDRDVVQLLGTVNARVSTSRQGSSLALTEEPKGFFLGGKGGYTGSTGIGGLPAYQFDSTSLGRMSGGVVLATNNQATVPGVGTGYTVTYVYNGTSNQVYPVDATTHRQIASPMSLSDFQARSQGAVDRLSDLTPQSQTAAVRRSNAEQDRANQYMAESQQLLPGNTTGEMLQNLGASGAGNVVSGTIAGPGNASGGRGVVANLAGNATQQMLGTGPVQVQPLIESAVQGGTGAVIQSTVASSNIINNGTPGNAIGAATVGAVRGYDSQRDRILGNTDEGTAGQVYGWARVAQGGTTAGVSQMVADRTQSGALGGLTNAAINTTLNPAAAVYPTVQALDRTQRSADELNNIVEIRTRGIAGQDGLSALQRLSAADSEAAAQLGANQPSAQMPAPAPAPALEQPEMPASAPSPAPAADDQGSFEGE